MSRALRTSTCNCGTPPAHNSRALHADDFGAAARRSASDTHWKQARKSTRQRRGARQWHACRGACAHHLLPQERRRLRRLCRRRGVRAVGRRTLAGGGGSAASPYTPWLLGWLVRPRPRDVASRLDGAHLQPYPHGLSRARRTAGAVPVTPGLASVLARHVRLLVCGGRVSCRCAACRCSCEHDLAGAACALQCWRAGDAAHALSSVALEPRAHVPRATALLTRCTASLVSHC